MAVQRLSLAEIETAILELTGYSSSTLAPWLTSANLYKRVNDYIQRIPLMAIIAGKQAGIIPQTAGTLRFDMYKTSATSAGGGAASVVVTAGTGVIYLPSDYDGLISLYNVTDKKPIHATEEIDTYFYDHLRNKSEGPPEACEIFGFESVSGVWRRKAQLYPDPPPAIIPVLILTYWRLPALMPGTVPATEYPDLDPKYSQVILYGVARELSRSQTAETKRWQELETEILLQMACTARAI